MTIVDPISVPVCAFNRRLPPVSRWAQLNVQSTSTDQQLTRRCYACMLMVEPQHAIDVMIALIPVATVFRVIRCYFDGANPLALCLDLCAAGLVASASVRIVILAAPGGNLKLGLACRQGRREAHRRVASR
ncbi:MAG: hypothetical protein Q7J84_05155 [Sulfuricaulis sp.]|nr:hypothetical protein [Sulfuricaulis sp.]